MNEDTWRYRLSQLQNTHNKLVIEHNKTKEQLEKAELAIEHIPVCECASWCHIDMYYIKNNGHHPTCKLYKEL